MEGKKEGGKSAQGMSTPKQSIYREYCAMENLGGKIQFLICS
jgi:hypothetical protein